MSFNGIRIRVSFACRLCTNCFDQVSDFIAHKKQNHFQEFRQTTSIVFEEKPTVNSSDGYVERGFSSSPVLVKLEAFDDASLNFEPGPEPQPGASISTQSNFEVIPNKSETVKNETPLHKHEIQQQPQFKNPFILLKRISRRKIQNFTKENSNRPHPTAATSTNDTTDPLKCRLCHKNFSSEPQLRIHVQICLLYNNNRANLAYCAKCIAFFPNFKQLQDHNDIFHVQKTIVEENTRTTTLSYSNSNVLPNIDCFEQNRPTKASEGLDRLRESVVDQYQNQQLRATVCKSDLKVKKLKRNNVNSTSHSSKHRFKCSFPNCGNAFKSKWNLQEHFWRHTGLRPYKCQVPNCGKAFANKGTWYNHKKTHIDVCLYKCPVTNCPVEFRAKISIRRHLIMDHS